MKTTHSQSQAPEVVIASKKPDQVLDFIGLFSSFITKIKTCASAVCGGNCEQGRLPCDCQHSSTKH